MWGKSKQMHILKKQDFSTNYHHSCVFYNVLEVWPVLNNTKFSRGKIINLSSWADKLPNILGF